MTAYNLFSSITPGALSGSSTQVAAISTIPLVRGMILVVDADLNLTGTPGSQVTLVIQETISATIIATAQIILPSMPSGNAQLTMSCSGSFTVPGTLSVPSAMTTNCAFALFASTNGVASIGATSGIFRIDRHCRATNATDALGNTWVGDEPQA